MFIPNTTCTWQSRTGFTKNGAPKLGPAVTAPCAIGSLNGTIAETPIRATASASGSDADESKETALLLFPASVTVATGDVLVASGVKLRAIGVLSCNDVFGQLDHFEVRCEAFRQ